MAMAEEGLEPSHPLRITDFKSVVSTIPPFGQLISILYQIIFFIKRLNWITRIFIKLPRACIFIITPDFRALTIIIDALCAPYTTMFITNVWRLIIWCFIIPTRNILIFHVKRATSSEQQH